MITPAVLISACGSLILATSDRLSKAVSRTREISQALIPRANDQRADGREEERRMLFTQLDFVTTRARLLQRALSRLYAAVAFFIGTSVAIAFLVAITTSDMNLQVLLALLPIGLGPNKVLSVPDAIGIALEKWMREKLGVQQELLGASPSESPSVEAIQPKPTPVTGEAGQGQYRFDAVNRSESFIGTCPDCGSSLEFAEGCAKCHVCGFSECG